MNISDHILIRNNQFIVCNKPAGMPVQLDKTGDHSLQQLAESYCQSTLFLIHRLDRAVSGVVLMAKNERAAAALSKQFQDGEARMEKIYYAVVQNEPPEKASTLTHYLRKDGKLKKSFVCQANEVGAQEAILHYRLIDSSDRYHLLEITLQTGRFHQIRAQLAAIGSPIKGDVKYGARRANPDRSIHLHAYSLRFVHPVSDEAVYAVAPFPDEALWNYFKDKI